MGGEGVWASGMVGGERERESNPYNIMIRAHYPLL